MIFGHEGLPRSGKSLEAMQHVVDSLNAGRTIVTNIAGISHKAISDYLAIPLPTVERLLICLEPPEDVAADEEKVVPWIKAQFLEHAVHDCLWIWDEINQFWPPERQPLPAAWAKFVTEHGHKGIDILIMGQDLSELHQTWRKRLQRYTRFTKLDMLGKEDHYHWASWSNAGKNKFRQTADGKKPYNKDFFGFYKSHEDATTNKGNYQDGRFSVFQRKHKIFAGLFAAAVAVACYHIYAFFNPDLGDVEPAQVQAVESVPVASKPAAIPVASSMPTAADVVSTSYEPIDYFDDFAGRYQLRLAGIIDRKEPDPGDSAYEFQLDFLDEAYRVKERMTRIDVASLGWAIERAPFGLRISKDGVEHIARAWPLDNFGKVPNAAVAALRPEP